MLEHRNTPIASRLVFGKSTPSQSREREKETEIEKSLKTKALPFRLSRIDRRSAGAMDGELSPAHYGSPQRHAQHQSTGADFVCELLVGLKTNLLLVSLAGSFVSFRFKTRLSGHTKKADDGQSNLHTNKLNDWSRREIKCQLSHRRYTFSLSPSLYTPFLCLRRCRLLCPPAGLLPFPLPLWALLAIRQERLASAIRPQAELWLRHYKWVGLLGNRFYNMRLLFLPSHLLPFFISYGRQIALD